MNTQLVRPSVSLKLLDREPPQPCPSPSDLPDSVVEAQRRASLDVFLENAAVGFHWSILDHMEDGMYITDLRRAVRYWSRGAERITGYSSADVLGRCCADNILNHIDEQGTCLCTNGCPLVAVMLDGRPRAANVFLHHKLGHRVPVHVLAIAIRDTEGQIIGAFETFADTSETIAAIERVQNLEQEAYRDALTGLANRRGFESELTARLDGLRRDGRAFGLIVCDVDHFKRFNDEHGHKTGDEVLKMVADALRHACRSCDVPARWGGEEFAVLTDQDSPERIAAVAERLRIVVEHSWIARPGGMLHVTISAGATSARPGDDAHSLVARADGLLYESKMGGRNRVTVRS